MLSASFIENYYIEWTYSVMMIYIECIFALQFITDTIIL